MVNSSGIITLLKRNTQKGNKMNELQKLQAELDQMNKDRLAVKTQNTVKCDAPKSKRQFTYKKSGQL